MTIDLLSNLVPDKRFELLTFALRKHCTTVVLIRQIKLEGQHHINIFMKIAIIGVARSKTTALTAKLGLEHPDHVCLYEYYTRNLVAGVPFNDISNELKNTENYIVKILSHNMFDREDQINGLNLEMYDKIFLIERPDFFNQCCSLQISSETKVWHQAGNKEDRYGEIRKKKFFLDKETILYQARGVQVYMMMKKYLIENQIPFTLHEYVDNIVPATVIADPHLDYPKLIINYALQDAVDQNFNINFNYETLLCNYTNFARELERMSFNPTFWC